MKQKLFSLLCLLMLGAGMATHAWVSVSPTGNKFSGEAVSYVKLTKLSTSGHYKVQFFNTSDQGTFCVADLDVTNTGLGNDVINGTHPYNKQSGNYVYNSAGNQFASSQGIKGEVGFVYLDYESNGWPVYHVSAIALNASSLANYVGYSGDYEVRSYDTDGTTRIDLYNYPYPETSEFADFKFGTDEISSEYWQYSDWAYNDDYILSIEAYTLSRTTNNYCLVNFWVNTDGKRLYNGEDAPLAGSYNALNPYKSSGYWYISDNTINYYAIGHSGTNDCSANSYTANMSNNYRMSNLTAFEEVIVEEGKDDYYYMRIYRSGGQLWATIGEPKKYSVSAISNNASLGTVTGSGSYKKGIKVTLTATETTGTFTQWNDGNTDNPRTIVVGTSDVVYTATFVANNATEYTISTAVSPAGAGTVSGEGEYYENTQATLTATSSDEHRYFFDHWEKDGVNVGSTATITPTVTADATYTAVFTVAANGTITGASNNDSYGTVTVSPSGSQNGGTAVTLTANANDGYTFTQWNDANTDNPRTVYVNGDATYTATFINGVTIDVQAAMTANSGFDDYVYKYWAKTPDYDIQIIGGNQGIYTEDADFDISYVNTSASYINDNGVNVTITNDFYGYFHTVDGKKVLDAQFTGSNGKYYMLTLRGKEADEDDTAEAYDNTYSTIKTKQEKETGIWQISGQNGTGETYSVTWCNHFYFATDVSKCGSVPNGIYQLDDSQDPGTLISTSGTNYKTYGSYFVQSYLYYVPASGYAEVVNRDETYYFAFDGYNSRGYTYKSKIGTAPYTLTTEAADNGRTDLIWHSSNCGDVTYTLADMPQKFFSGNSVTYKAVPATGYELARWSDEDANVTESAYGLERNVTVSGNMNIHAIFKTAAVKYTVTINTPENGTLTVVDEDETAITSGDKVEEGTVLTVTATPATGYHFSAWTNDGAASVTVNADKTIGATFAANLSAIELEENRENSFYNTFKTTYNGATGLVVTYNRQFTASRWSTMCLPFSLDLATMIANKMYGCVYEFKYATGNANVGSGVNLYFSNAKSIEAGKCYIVNANAELAAKTSFVFSGVTIDLSKDNGAALDSKDAYDDLPGYKSQGTIELVGTLRNGTLQGSAKDNTYMGLKNNKIYYPNTTYPGSTIWAYRGIFRSTSALNVEKMRIVVDGEDRGELILDADGDILAPSDAQSRKFIENGVLYIEREGVIYDAQGKRIK